MGYVAIKGGGRAIAGAEAAVEALRCAEGEKGTPLSLSAIEQQLRLLTSRVVSEGGLYHPRTSRCRATRWRRPSRCAHTARPSHV